MESFPLNTILISCQNSKDSKLMNHLSTYWKLCFGVQEMWVFISVICYGARSIKFVLYAYEQKCSYMSFLFCLTFTLCRKLITVINAQHCWHWRSTGTISNTMLVHPIFDHIEQTTYIPILNLLVKNHDRSYKTNIISDIYTQCQLDNAKSPEYNEIQFIIWDSNLRSISWCRCWCCCCCNDEHCHATIPLSWYTIQYVNLILSCCCWLVLSYIHLDSPMTVNYKLYLLKML